MASDSSLVNVMPLPNSLWDFACNVYASPDIERQARQLQDDYQANINIMLWCCWLQREDIRLSVNLLDEVLVTIDALSLQTVAKLREVRRVLEQSGSFTKVQALSVKKHILHAELMIEKVLLQRLQDLTCRFLEATVYKQMCAHDSTLDLEHYLSFINVPEAHKHAALLLNMCRRQTMEQVI